MTEKEQVGIGSGSCNMMFITWTAAFIYAVVVVVVVGNARARDDDHFTIIMTTLIIIHLLSKPDAAHY